VGYKVFTVLALTGANLGLVLAIWNAAAAGNLGAKGSTALAITGTGKTGETTAVYASSNDPLSGEQWALERINLTESDRARSGKGVVVAVLDTGIDTDHEDLSGKVTQEVNFTHSLSTGDVNGHGTHVAGIIAATRNNGIGTSGIAPEVNLWNVKVADDQGLCRAEDVARGIRWATDRGAKVINISLQIQEPSAELDKAVAYAWERGVVVVTAAGNNGSTTPVYPAGNIEAIAVTALDRENRLAVLANYGDWVDVAAPGTEILSTLPGNDYGYETGTSFATAQVSGLAALLFNIVTDQNGNGRINDEVRYFLEKSCRETRDVGTGRGLINTGEALEAASTACR
jgi:thermitase